MCQRSSIITDHHLIQDEHEQQSKQGVHSALVLLKHGAVLQHLCGRTVLEDVVAEMDERLFHPFDTLPS